MQRPVKCTMCLHDGWKMQESLEMMTGYLEGITNPYADLIYDSYDYHVSYDAEHVTNRPVWVEVEAWGGR